MLYNKQIVLIILTITTLAQLHGTYKDTEKRNVLVEAKGASFVPINHRFREIYGTGGTATGELSVQIVKGLFGWASVGLFTKHGRSIGECNQTKVTIIPLGFGLKYFWDFNCGDLYIGAGVLGTHLKTNDSSPFVIHHRSKWGIDGIAKIGFIFDLPRSFFIDLFSDYTFGKVHFPNKFQCGVQSHSANIAGWSIGLGIGYRFA